VSIDGPFLSCIAPYKYNPGTESSIAPVICTHISIYRYAHILLYIHLSLFTFSGIALYQYKPGAESSIAPVLCACGRGSPRLDIAGERSGSALAYGKGRGWGLAFTRYWLMSTLLCVRTDTILCKYLGLTLNRGTAPPLDCPRYCAI